jgi:crotonobetainyl-CoA:carnitine CoA-transferase CaiB-like acyl-CoA transferase
MTTFATNEAASSAASEVSARTGALAGVKVIDMTSVLMGPYATQILGDFGADVIKVEPIQGDTFRYAGPSRHRGMGSLFLHVNRNKRSIALDLKTPEGLEAVLKLCESADVLAYNVRPQAMQRLGLGYEDVLKRNPSIVYAGMFGFGRGGPYAADPAYDDLIQGLTGFPATYARSTGNAPAYIPANICDRTVGLYAVGAIAAALFYRQRTGKGQMVDIPMFETMAQFMLGDNLYGETFVPSIGPSGYARLMSSERKPYATSDGFLCVLPYTDRHWASFFALAGRQDLNVPDSRFSTMAKRTANIDELYRIVSVALGTDTTSAWLAKLRAADIPVAPMHTIESMLADEHLNAVGFFKQAEHPSEGAIRTMKSPSDWSESPASERHPAPCLGEHSAEILREIGYDDSAIGQMLERGISINTQPI